MFFPYSSTTKPLPVSIHLEVTKKKTNRKIAVSDYHTK